MAALPSLAGSLTPHRSCPSNCPAGVYHSFLPAQPHYFGAGVLPPRLRRRALSLAAKENESSEDAYERRLKESQKVEERVEVIFSEEEFRKALDEAEQKLVVLEVESSNTCDTGVAEEAEVHWEEDKQAKLARCSNLKHTFQRTARDCPDVKFLLLEADTDEGQAACDKLGVDVLPTVQFWRSKKKLWEHRGILHLEQDLGEGVLFYGDSAANGVKASSFVEEISSKAQLENFVQSQPENVLTVVNVSSNNATPCVRVFPAVMALAKNFTGYAAFARLLYETSQETQSLANELRVLEVPTFIFYRNGKEVGRHVGSSRGDLIGKILEQQAALGIKPPSPSVPAGAARRRTSANA
ncbi:hypothetical protein CVIRNUC_002607 [Coccomyxa viridis]|uniref:Thioredoxin domain-containing protein n=1 Tax=Coccomyxa viridis TaxID=1274662 RepID=A0AAV1HZW5_9CHLO|nr:hypothetical protein CVIRNUC_002607 [Coccomyxa viridis]